MAERQLVLLNVNNEQFGIDTSRINTIERSMDFYRVPNTPGYVEGLVNLRGNVYTVFSIRKRLGLPPKDSDENTRIIMANTESSVAGLVADCVNEIIKVEDEDIESAQAEDGIQGKFIKGVIRSENRKIFLLDIDSFFGVEEPAKASV